MISPIYNNDVVNKTRNLRGKQNTVDYVEYKRRKLLRRAYLKRQREMAIRRLITCLFILLVGFMLFVHFSYNNIYMPLKNWGYDYKASPNIFYSTEAMLSNIGMFGQNYLTDSTVKTAQPLMTPITENRELSGLKARLLPVVAGHRGYRAGIYVYDLQTQNFVSINGNKLFATASIIKIPVLIELFRQIDKSFASIQQEVPFFKLHLASGSGGLQYKPTGNYYSLDYLAKIMIQHSDNTATNIILDEVGGSYFLNKAMKSWGIKQGHMQNWLPDLTGTNVMTPKEFAVMLYNLNNKNFLSPFSRQKINEYMTGIKRRNLIKSGLPAGSVLAHKTGDIGTMVGDAGIATLPDGRQIIIVALVERPWNSYKAKEMIREASRITFNYFSNH